jgi:site-specific recombinase XerD
MLLDLFPTTHLQYTSLPIVGPILEGYSTWLLTEGHSRARVAVHCHTARRLARVLPQRGVGTLIELTRDQLRGCAPRRAREDAALAALVHGLERYFERALLLYPREPLSPVEQRIEVYATYLDQVRGLAPATITRHRRTAAAFLAHAGYDTSPQGVATLTAQDVEAFVRGAGQRLGRASLHNVVAEIRAFLRFLVSVGEAPVGLDERIDAPRVYRHERLPRAWSWDIVQAFLRAIDRTSRSGLRDYPIFLLIATYGLRVSEVVGLTIDDIDWRTRRFRIRQRKTGGVLWLPLTDEVGTAVLEYLQRGRPTPTKPYRHVFLRGRTPTRPLTRTALNAALAGWATRGGLARPFYGVHGLRHAYAVHLLRLGTPLKTIGDVLGHRTIESTYVYLHLAVEDLRDVALDLPAGVTDHANVEVAP